MRLYWLNKYLVFYAAMTEVSPSAVAIGAAYEKISGKSEYCVKPAPPQHILKVSTPRAA
jgi:hypothetical protein